MVSLTYQQRVVQTMSLAFAGSAIAQEVGLLKNFDDWKLSKRATKWLLIAGASDPPCKTSRRRARYIDCNEESSFLHGVTKDLAKMENSLVVKKNLYNTVRDFYLEKDEAVMKLKKIFSACQKDRTKPVLYYTGHGEVGTGNWCFHDGTISIQEIEELVPPKSSYPLIISDACYSGHWANYCARKKLPGFECLAAAPEFATAQDTGEERGKFNLFQIFVVGILKISCEID